MMLENVRKNQIRSEILAGVYRENRRVFHDEHPAPGGRPSHPLRGKATLFVIALLYLFFGDIGTLDSSLYERHVPPGPSAITRNIPPEAAAGAESPSPKVPAARVDREPHPAPASAELARMSAATCEDPFPRAPQVIEAHPAGGMSKVSARLPITDSDNFSLRQVFGLNVQTIVIDPGHGGKDPGTIGKMGLQEKDVALDIAKRLKARLERYGLFNVLLTRKKDATMYLRERIDFANSREADLFISLHVNYVPSVPENFIETYYFGPAESESDLELALLENADSMVGINEFSEMGKQLGGALKFQESRQLASSIQESLFTNISKSSQAVLDRGIKQAPFLVIMGTEMPGVLAEVTCLSNREEEKKLREPTYREDIAAYLETGIRNYLTKGDYIYAARSKRHSESGNRPGDVTEFGLGEQRRQGVDR